ncbi:DUF6132 family protein [Candidatus Omnitrophota bacterium]
MTLECLGIVIGGVVGLAVGHIFRCVSGMCPLTSNPVITTIIGALVGFMIAIGK